METLYGINAIYLSAPGKTAIPLQLAQLSFQNAGDIYPNFATGKRIDYSRLCRNRSLKPDLQRGNRNTKTADNSR